MEATATAPATPPSVGGGFQVLLSKRHCRQTATAKWIAEPGERPPAELDTASPGIREGRCRPWDVQGIIEFRAGTSTAFEVEMPKRLCIANESSLLDQVCAHSLYGNDSTITLLWRALKNYNRQAPL